jgi:rfaE bifunctional protein nucleotidyltransferase chain/domain
MVDQFTEPRTPETETYDRGLFGFKANPEARFVPNYETLEAYVNALRVLGMKIVLTSGSFDMVHVGHARYLEKAKEFGDVLVVGVDSDAKVKKRKGESRPIVPEEERVQMLAHMRSVDLVTLKYPDEPQWELIKRIQPDTLIVTKETYTPETITQLEEICGRVVVLEPQAETSTSAKIRLMHVGWSHEIVEPIDKALAENGASEELRRAIAARLLRQSHGDGEA